MKMTNGINSWKNQLTDTLEGKKVTIIGHDNIEERYLKKMDTEEKLEVLVKKLTKDKKTIATMESCTGGGLAYEITNISGASEILKKSYITYCNEAKIELGVPKEVIEKYTVYSAETAVEMAKAVKNLASSNIGVGITGQLGRIDPNNPTDELNNVWYAINNDGKITVNKIKVADMKRSKQKQIVIREIIETLYNIA